MVIPTHPHIALMGNYESTNCGLIVMCRYIVVKVHVHAYMYYSMHTYMYMYYVSCLLCLLIDN